MTKQANGTTGTALITGASSGIGKTYADRLARRGYDLVLVARDRERMEALAARLREETGVSIDIIQADLTDAADLRRVEARLVEDERIDLLVNNAGASAGRGLEGTDVEVLDRLIRLNVTAVTRLAAAVIPRFVAKGKGSIINIASVMAFMPEAPSGIYSATKSYVLTYSQSMQAELGPKGLYVQAVLPAATRTEIWERAGRDINTIPGLMEVDELVDAALVGFDRRELVTIPPLHDAAQWEALETARRAMLPGFQQERAAPRYRG
ncbi:SDR family oxidoreductase [Trinickia sp. YCB016]